MTLSLVLHLTLASLLAVSALELRPRHQDGVLHTLLSKQRAGLTFPNISGYGGAEERRNYVKSMMRHAWEGYATHAWGENELRPVSCGGHNNSVFGAAPLAVSVVESLGTLYVMGMMTEYKAAREWVANNLDIDRVDTDAMLSVFEINIRFLGGLLSIFSMTGDSMFRDKARQIADRLMPAFETKTGIPLALINFGTGVTQNYGWAGTYSILSEFGTFHLEFSYLSDVTGDPKYREKVEKIRDFLRKMEKPRGLYPSFVHPVHGNWGKKQVSLGGMGDSFYEYLLKSWLQSGRADAAARAMFDEAMRAVLDNLLQTSRGNLTFVSDMLNDEILMRSDHLACFAGGMFALASTSLANELSGRYLDVAKQLTRTCRETYLRSVTGLGPDVFYFNDHMEAESHSGMDRKYILRPELVESYFYLWRFTKEQKYRDWGWEIVQSLEQHCRTACGYSGINNVYSAHFPDRDDLQHSFFLAETLKYLYLLYSDDSVLPLDQWVFNTEGHPLPIKGVNPKYRAARVV